MVIFLVTVRSTYRQHKNITYFSNLHLVLLNHFRHYNIYKIQKLQKNTIVQAKLLQRPERGVSHL